MASSILMQASRQFMSRPADERFVSLPEMFDHFDGIRRASKQAVVSSRKLRVEPTGNTSQDGIVIVGPTGNAATMSHYSFGQVSSLSGAPAGYLRTLPAPIAADCLNVGLMQRDVEDVGVLLTRGQDVTELRAATGPNYGRVWNRDVVGALQDRFGDGVTGDFRVPGEFGKAVHVNRDNTTLYASDRDMFVFLADEVNRIENPNRRNGESGSLARGFFVWNSEVGDKTLGVGLFLFDYVCCNRIVWGAEGYKEFRIRHTSGAPDRFVSEVAPTLIAFANASAAPIERALAAAKDKRIDDVDAFLAQRFTRRQADLIAARHVAEEGRPIETLWDATTAVTALARDIRNTDDRLELERAGGKILQLAA